MGGGIFLVVGMVGVFSVFGRSWLLRGGFIVFTVVRFCFVGGKASRGRS